MNNNPGSMFPHLQSARRLSRREMLRRCSLGFGSFALAGLFSDKTYGALASANQSAGPHFKPRVRNVIFCYMSGGVSHVDSFDPKPELSKRHGKAMPVPVKPTM